MQYDGMVGTAAVVLRRLRADRQENGLLHACAMFVRLCFLVICTPLFSLIRGRRTFGFDGKNYRYFCHWYNTTFDNERAVELALALYELKNAGGKRVLEVGNVLSHYIPVSHDVLDKYEKGAGIINEDIVDFHVSRPYDLIISLSTIEHVGFDEHPREPDKIIRAERRLRELLAPGGRALITMPVGYNPHATALLRSAAVFHKQRYLRRVSRDNRWVETTKDAAFAASFNTPYSFANALVVCTLTR